MQLDKWMTCWMVAMGTNVLNFMHAYSVLPLHPPSFFFYAWEDLTNGVLTLNSVLDGELHGEPPFSTHPPDIVAQLNVNASESISLAQPELRRRWVCVSKKQCISSKRKGVFNANDLITNSPAHYVGPKTLRMAVDLFFSTINTCNTTCSINNTFGIL